MDHLTKEKVVVLSGLGYLSYLVATCPCDVLLQCNHKTTKYYAVLGGLAAYMYYIHATK